MIETVAFLIFVTGIFYVVRWSIINDDLAPKKKAKFGAAQATPQPNVGNPTTSQQKKPIPHQ